MEQIYYMTSRKPDELEDMKAVIRDKLQGIEAEIAAQRTRFSDLPLLEALLNLDPLEKKRVYKLLMPHAEAALLSMILTDINCVLSGFSSSSLVLLSDADSFRFANLFTQAFKQKIEDFSFFYIIRYVLLLRKIDVHGVLPIAEYFREMKDAA